jgi:hypothetical protein
MERERERERGRERGREGEWLTTLRWRVVNHSPYHSEQPDRQPPLLEQLPRDPICIYMYIYI